MKRYRVVVDFIVTGVVRKEGEIEAEDEQEAAEKAFIDRQFSVSDFDDVKDIDIDYDEIIEIEEIS